MNFLALSGSYYDATAKDNIEIENLVAYIPERLCMVVRKRDLDITSGIRDMTTAILDSTLFDILGSFDENLNETAKFPRSYMHPENQIFFASVLSTYKCKIFFAHDLYKYVRWTPHYLADMTELKIKDPETWNALDTGEIFSVFKSDILFCGLGVDQGLEENIRNLKIPGDVVGITQKESLLLDCTRTYMNHRFILG